jgi:hypothetical protein
MSGVVARGRAEPTRGHSTFGVTRVEVKGFRSAREVAFAPGPLCALVGEAEAGKSNLLAAIRAVLDPVAAPLRPTDAAAGGDGQISIRIGFAGGAEATLEAAPGRAAVAGADQAPPVLFLPAGARARGVVAGGPPRAARAQEAVEIFTGALGGEPTSAARALSLVDALESCSARGITGLVLLIEEPELYLRPHAQRYLYRLLREFTAAGNQVIYATHSANFLNVTRLDELVFVDRLSGTGTRALHPEPVTADEDFRVITEFDAMRSELFLARAVVLVEGLTEKLVLPFVFAALGYDVDREAISVVECGGKPNIPLFARICRATGIPFVAVHDSDRKRDGRMTRPHRVLNELIADTAGPDSVLVLDPDFETVAGLRGHRRKPERAWRQFATRGASEIPSELVRVAELAVALTRSYAKP